MARAATGNPANRPDPDKDPVAWEGYQRASADPALVQAILPDRQS